MYVNLMVDNFNKHFAHWDIIIPKENMKTRHGGYIQYKGWLIQYCFGKDKTDKEYLDYYAAHRMTDDSHRRIYDDGKE